ncbi:MAG: phosphoadenosine phosphosulfate reductase family protein [Blastocatellia bacterium]
MGRARLQLPLFEDSRCPAMRPDTSTLLPLREYYKIIVFYSGGKDSLAALLYLLELGVEPERIELWHQSIDGRPRVFGGEAGLMDWPVTEGYVIATARAMGLTLRWQWKEGGFEGEMLRRNSRTTACTYQLGDGTFKTSGGTRGKESSRLMFPQVTGDLTVRWCSSYLKIDVASAAICGDPRFEGKNILVVSGERREESLNRSRYAEVEKHKATSSLRRVDQWRAVIDWRERDVWEIIKRHRILPHAAYRLGFSRVSCMTCIFGGPREWATIKQIDRSRFYRIADYERTFGVTIQRGESVIQQAERAGGPLITGADQELINEAMTPHFDVSRFFIPTGQEWTLPRGAFRHGAGPS